MSDRPTPYSSKNRDKFIPSQNIEPSGLNSLTEASYEQGSLFSEGIQRNSRLYYSGASYEMGSQSLQAWKQAIAKYQSSITTMIPAVQTSLFDLPSTHCDPHAINPFVLPIQPAEFYRLPSRGSDDACIYFVIDLTTELQSPVLLYIGETCRSHKRWKGIHDCKRYLLNYRDLHNTHNLQTQVVMSFWWDAPSSSRPRQQLERSLIEKWRSPFNKENWSFWGTPFVN
ncbi:MAG: GIY-YIG nuclease family protein [Pseudanabaena sp.]